MCNALCTHKHACYKPTQRTHITTQHITTTLTNAHVIHNTQGGLPPHLLAGPVAAAAAWARGNPALAAHAHVHAQRAAATHALLLQVIE